MRFLTWLLTYAAGLAIAALMLDGIWFNGPSSGSAELKEKVLPLMIVALILGLVSTFIEPVIKVLSLPSQTTWIAIAIITVVGWGIRETLPIDGR